MWVILKFTLLIYTSQFTMSYVAMNLETVENQDKNWVSWEWKELFRWINEVKTIFHNFWDALIWLNILKNRLYKLSVRPSVHLSIHPSIHPSFAHHISGAIHQSNHNYSYTCVKWWCLQVVFFYFFWNFYFSGC